MICISRIEQKRMDGKVHYCRDSRKRCRSAKAMLCTTTDVIKWIAREAWRVVKS